MAKAKRTSPKARDVDEHHSMSMRRISNGFVVSTSKSGPKGYSHSEEYHPTKPKLDVSPAKPKTSPKGKSAGPKDAGAKASKAMASAWK